MQTNIFSLIEELVSMSGSTSDFDALNSELSLLEIEIPKIKKEIKELTSSMTEDKYFDASQEIVDRNIELSVSKKLNKLEKEFDELQQKQDELQAKEKEVTEIVESLNKKITSAKKTIEMINNRIESSSEEKTKNVYSNVFKEENAKIEVLQEKLEDKNNLLEKFSSEVASINEVVDKTKEEIEQSTARLMDVRKNLNNKKCYVDEALKKKDNETLDNLKSKLSEYDAKKLNILTDANYVASEIKDLFIAEENDKALKKLLELVTIVNTKPYMEINDTAVLEEELTKLEKEQNELINAIENKEYYGSDVKYLDNRIDHLKELIDLKKAKIEEIKAEIENIDNKLVTNITNELKTAEKEANELEESIANYHELIKDDNKKSPNAVAALHASYNKKNNELNIINNIIERYSKELSNLIESSAKLENEDIKNLEIEISEYKSEIEEINKIKLLSTKTKDAIEQEKDKNTLKELNDNIKALKQRIRFEKTPQEIYDQIEMILSAGETSVTTSETSIVSNEKTEAVDNNINAQTSIEGEEDVANSNSLFANIETKDELAILKNESELPNAETENNNLINEVTPSTEEKVLEKTLFDEFNNFEIPEYKEDEEGSIQSEPVLASEESDLALPKDEEEEYTFSELEDTNYFSLDEFLKKLDSQKEE